MKCALLKASELGIEPQQPHSSRNCKDTANNRRIIKNLYVFEPHHEKNCFLHMQKQRTDVLLPSS